MAAVRSLRVSVESDTGLLSPSSGSEGEPEAEPEPMEVEEGELEPFPVQRSFRQFNPDTSRRYENKAGTFITGIDVTSKEAVEKKEQRAKRFHFRAEVNLAQRNVVLDKELLKKAIPKIRLEALHVCGVDEMSTQDLFEYFKEYPPAHIEWLDDNSCNVVWLDEATAMRALLNMSQMPEAEKASNEENHEKQTTQVQKDKQDVNSAESAEDSTEEGEVEDKDSEEEHEKKNDNLPDALSQAEQNSVLQNEPRRCLKPAKGGDLYLRFATKDDKKALGAARRSLYYMKYGNPNYGGMKGILSSSWKRRFHSRRLHRDVIKKRNFISEVGLTSPYKHRHAGKILHPLSQKRLVIKEQFVRAARMTIKDCDFQVECDLVIKMFTMRGYPEPLVQDLLVEVTQKRVVGIYKSILRLPENVATKIDSHSENSGNVRNSMRADTVAASNIKDRIGSKTEKVEDVRLLLEEKRQTSGLQHAGGSTKTDVRQRLGKRPHTPEKKHAHTPERKRSHTPKRKRTHSSERKRTHSSERKRSRSSSRKSKSKVSVIHHETVSDIHSRLGNNKQDVRGLYSDSRDRKSGNLWKRLGKASKQKEKFFGKAEGSDSSQEDDDTALQKAWGAMIKKKELSRQKKSRLDNLPSLQIEISRGSSSGTDSES
ncbi:nuclear cap-binding protein subunit 3 [Protopterus annectens]|uniref:nuclear cap-binding protein subunit 3 n=1 Tax=Protopterus annectens TaxID=7888 RepID=UPI001CF947FE|nr:nuclear cap-binding protein subunit 3 [Protopterus annectens]